MKSLLNRSFLEIMDYTKEELYYYLNLSKKLKKEKKENKEIKRLEGKNFALIFEKESTRTRCSFEVAAHDQGAFTSYLGSSGTQIRKKESIADTARVLGSMYDAIEYRGFDQSTIKELSKFAGVPVWNGLTNYNHPTQVLANFLTLQENLNKSLDKLTFAYIGSGQSNIAHSFMAGACKLGMNFRIVGPKQYFPEDDFYKKCLEESKKSNSKILFTENLEEGLKGVDVIYTGVWVVMGEPYELWKERINTFKKYRITKEVMNLTGVNTVFCHCLPSFHNDKTDIGKYVLKNPEFGMYGLNGIEVDEEVFEGKNSLAFQEAENRMHTIKAVMVATFYDYKL